MGTRDTIRKNQYNKEHFRRINLNVHKEEYIIWEEHIYTTGEPMNTFIKRAVRRQIEEDNNAINNGEEGLWNLQQINLNR